MSASDPPRGRAIEPGAPAPIGRTLGIARPAARRLALASLLGAGAIGAAIGLMGTAAWLLSRAAQHPSESALAVAIVLVQFFGLSRGFLRYGERLVGHDAAFRVLAAQRVRIYRHLERLAPAGLPAFRSGDLLSRLVADVDSLQDLILRVIPPFAIAVLVGTATVGLVWALLPAAGMVLLSTLLASATVVPWLTGTLARRNESNQAELRGELTASVLDLIEGASELAVYGATAAQLARISSDDRELTAVATSSAATAGIGLGLTTLLSGLAAWGILLVGVPAVHTGRLGGVWLAVVALIPLAAFELVSGLPVAAQTLQRARRTAARLFAIIDAPDPVPVASVTVERPTPPVDLEVRALWAGYPDAPHPVLRGIDLSLPPGKRIAIVGPSGAGKSTLASVLLGFLPIEAGSVRLNGTSTAQLSGDDLRGLVGLVGQDAHLFDTSVAENLRIGRRSASDADLREVIGRVGLGPWLESLPAGLDTEVGRFGARVSGGQGQRLAVARALLADFPVLVLDEPAEHLDLDAADALTADLLAVTEGRSTVMITHRLTGLQAVDEILLVSGGRVVERGSHAELLECGANYAALWWNEANAERGARELSNRRLTDESPRAGSPGARSGDHVNERSVAQ
ncbi:MAG TPA: thiol reductant ABC exporter subunit CydC [Acidimicrobiales bacterium]|nr:thiol reductant ABC exporter subunit CydC [Acidimicrobiales bacterium]